MIMMSDSKIRGKKLPLEEISDLEEEEISDLEEGEIIDDESLSSSFSVDSLPEFESLSFVTGPLLNSTISSEINTKISSTCQSKPKDENSRVLGGRNVRSDHHDFKENNKDSINEKANTSEQALNKRTYFGDVVDKKEESFSDSSSYCSSCTCTTTSSSSDSIDVEYHYRKDSKNSSSRISHSSKSYSKLESSRGNSRRKRPKKSSNKVSKEKNVHPSKRPAETSKISNKLVDISKSSTVPLLKKLKLSGELPSTSKPTNSKDSSSGKKFAPGSIGEMLLNLRKNDRKEKRPDTEMEKSCKIKSQLDIISTKEKNEFHLKSNHLKENFVTNHCISDDEDELTLRYKALQSTLRVGESNKRVNKSLPFSEIPFSDNFETEKCHDNLKPLQNLESHMIIPLADLISDITDNKCLSSEIFDTVSDREQCEGNQKSSIMLEKDEMLGLLNNAALDIPTISEPDDMEISNSSLEDNITEKKVTQSDAGRNYSVSIQEEGQFPVEWAYMMPPPLTAHEPDNLRKINTWCFNQNMCAQAIESSFKEVMKANQEYSLNCPSTSTNINKSSFDGINNLNGSPNLRDVHAEQYKAFMSSYLLKNENNNEISLQRKVECSGMLKEPVRPFLREIVPLDELSSMIENAGKSRIMKEEKPENDIINEESKEQNIESSIIQKEKAKNIVIEKSKVQNFIENESSIMEEEKTEIVIVENSNEQNIKSSLIQKDKAQNIVMEISKERNIIESKSSIIKEDSKKNIVIEKSKKQSIESEENSVEYSEDEDEDVLLAQLLIDQALKAQNGSGKVKSGKAKGKNLSTKKISPPSCQTNFTSDKLSAFSNNSTGDASLKHAILLKKLENEQSKRWAVHNYEPSKKILDIGGSSLDPKVSCHDISQNKDAQKFRFPPVKPIIISLQSDSDSDETIDEEENVPKGESSTKSMISDIDMLIKSVRNTKDLKKCENKSSVEKEPPINTPVAVHYLSQSKQEKYRNLKRQFYLKTKLLEKQKSSVNKDSPFTSSEECVGESDNSRTGECSQNDDKEDEFVECKTEFQGVIPSDNEDEFSLRDQLLKSLRLKTLKDEKDSKDNVGTVKAAESNIPSSTIERMTSPHPLKVADKLSEKRDNSFMSVCNKRSLQMLKNKFDSGTVVQTSTLPLTQKNETSGIKDTLIKITSEKIDKPKIVHSAIQVNDNQSTCFSKSERNEQVDLSVKNIPTASRDPTQQDEEDVSCMMQQKTSISQPLKAISLNTAKSLQISVPDKQIQSPPELNIDRDKNITFLKKAEEGLISKRSTLDLATNDLILLVDQMEGDVKEYNFLSFRIKRLKAELEDIEKKQWEKVSILADKMGKFSKSQTIFKDAERNVFRWQEVVCDLGKRVIGDNYKLREKKSSNLKDGSLNMRMNNLEKNTLSILDREKKISKLIYPSKPSARKLKKNYENFKIDNRPINKNYIPIPTKSSSHASKNRKIGAITNRDKVVKRNMKFCPVSSSGLVSPKLTPPYSSFVSSKLTSPSSNSKTLTSSSPNLISSKLTSPSSNARKPSTDDFGVLCPYDLLGRCNDDLCIYQHVSSKAKNKIPLETNPSLPQILKSPGSVICKNSDLSSYSSSSIGMPKSLLKSTDSSYISNQSTSQFEALIDDKDLLKESSFHEGTKEQGDIKQEYLNKNKDILSCVDREIADDNVGSALKKMKTDISDKENPTVKLECLDEDILFMVDREIADDNVGSALKKIKTDVSDEENNTPLLECLNKDENTLLIMKLERADDDKVGSPLKKMKTDVSDTVQQESLDKDILFTVDREIADDNVGSALKSIKTDVSYEENNTPQLECLNKDEDPSLTVKAGGADDNVSLALNKMKPGLSPENQIIQGGINDALDRSLKSPQKRKKNSSKCQSTFKTSRGSLRIRDMKLRNSSAKNPHLNIEEMKFFLPCVSLKRLDPSIIRKFTLASLDSS